MPRKHDARGDSRSGSVGGVTADGEPARRIDPRDEPDALGEGNRRRGTPVRAGPSALNSDNLSISVT